jgi:putative thioredoxin
MSSYDTSDFSTDVLDRSRTVPVLVDFWAEWCGPCRMLGPVLEKLAAEANGRWELRKLNTEQFPDVAQRYGIRSIPAVKLFVDGRVVNEFVGALPEHQIRQWLTQSLPDPHAASIEQADALLLAGQHAPAAEVLRPVLAAAPQHERASVLMARAVLYDDPASAVTLIKMIDEASAQHLIAESIRTIAALLERARTPESFPEGSARPLYSAAVEALRARDFDAALERFIQVIREDRRYDDDGARKACIAIFKYLGEEHEITARHRRAFGSALYV